jgi:hypothetical protein
MRKIEEKMIKAVLHKKSWSSGNTQVSSNDDKSTVWLHGHKIVTINWPEMSIEANDCGWATRTTKSRLNAILKKLSGVRLYQKRGTWLVSYTDSDIEQPWDGSMTFSASFRHLRGAPC